MKRLLTLLAACIAACAATAQSRIETFTFRSALLGAEKTCSVYLPAGYDDSGRSYPVLYLLHGASGYHGDWAEKGNMRQIADEAIAAGTALPMIVVMPDASGTGENYTGDRMGYFNVPGWPYERFFFEEFVPAVERRYRICGDKARRAISGLSMGGGGTAVYALRHPELFGSACPMSGLLEAYGDPGENAFRRSVAENNPVQMVRDLSDAEAAAQCTVAGGWTAATTTSWPWPTSTSTRPCACATSRCNTGCATAATRGAIGRPHCTTSSPSFRSASPNRSRRKAPSQTRAIAPERVRMRVRVTHAAPPAGGISSTNANSPGDRVPAQSGFMSFLTGSVP